AARALGLDVGPMSGFDAAGVQAEFFAGTAIEPNFIVNLGYGSDENLYPRSPRLAFEEAAEIV
ncbi:MAG: nitroreductase family protein, partial [Brevundimonas sp.]